MRHRPFYMVDMGYGRSGRPRAVVGSARSGTPPMRRRLAIPRIAKGFERAFESPWDAVSRRKLSPTVGSVDSVAVVY
jgi:hypothetical protein